MTSPEVKSVVVMITKLNKMKIRDSGMPEEEMWSKFFDPDFILKQMEVTNQIHTIVDLGCGFGTFTLPASQLIKSKVYAFDIDEAMIQQTQSKIDELKIKNIELHLLDFISEGTGIPNNSIDYVVIFNILHHDNPNYILKEVFRILKSGAKAGIIHWRSDIQTPRGPSLKMRPTPEQCQIWSLESGFFIKKETILEPYHFGIVISKP